MTPRHVLIFPHSRKPMQGKIVSAGVEQSEVEIITGSEMLVGKVQTFSNNDLVYERKSAGPEKDQDYDPARATSKTKTKEKPMDENQEDHRAIYNSLVEQANSLGLQGYKPISTKFRDAATGAKRCEALSEAIEAHRAKIASGEINAASPGEPSEPEAEQPPPPPPPKNQEKKPMGKTQAKKKGKASPAKKAVKTAPKKSAVANKPAMARTGVVAEFGTREGTNREALLLCLYAKKNKQVPLTEVAKAVYGDGSLESRLKVKAVIIGLNVMIEEGKLPYKRVEYEGRGDEATVMLASKSGR
jgi:hypothetical protein